MSHFTLIVVGDNIDEQLKPYAEQEAEKEYLIFNDTEDESMQEYLTKDVDIVVLADGSLYNMYDEKFKFVEGKPLSNDFTYPQDSIIRKGKFLELYNSFEDYMENWCGEAVRDSEKGRYGYWYNPNAKYDWYS